MWIFFCKMFNSAYASYAELSVLGAQSRSEHSKVNSQNKKLHLSIQLLGSPGRGDALIKVASGKFLAKAGSNFVAARPTVVEPTTYRFNSACASYAELSVLGAQPRPERSTVNLQNKKLHLSIQLLGSPGRIRTYDLSVNSRALHH